MTNLEWIKNMDAEQMAREVLAPCGHYDCRTCPVKGTCLDDEKAMEWLMKEHVEDRG